MVDADMLRPPAEWLQQEPVRLLRDYVRIDTSDRNGEIEGVEFLKRFFDCAGIETEVVCPAPRRCNLLARLPGRSRQGALLLLNHVDVVGAFPQLWKEAPPFSGAIKIGYVYGRGSFDDKSLGLAQAIAMREVKRLGIVPASDILFLAEADEEYGQAYGSRWLLEHRPEWFSGVGQVLNEGGVDEMVIRTVRFWGLETVQAGYGLIEFHSKTPEPLAAIAGRWKRIASTPVAQPHPHVVEGFGLLANHLVYPLTDPLRHLDRVLRDPAELAQLPDRYAVFLQARIGWSAPYAFPLGAKDNYRSFVTVYTPPGEAPDPYLAPILADASANKIEVLRTESSGATRSSPYPTAFTDLLKRVIGVLYPGVPFGPLPTLGGSTTSIYFQDRGIPAYGFSPIALNIGDAARRHGNDERVFIRDYLNGIEVLNQVVLEYVFPQKVSPRAGD